MCSESATKGDSPSVGIRPPNSYRPGTVYQTDVVNALDRVEARLDLMNGYLERSVTALEEIAAKLRSVRVPMYLLNTNGK